MNWYSQISKVSGRVFILTPPHFYSYLFAGEDLAIVDTGPGEMIPWVPPAYPVILNSLDLFNFDKASVKWLLITEPHLDHIGGLENLLDELPNATVATSKKNGEEIEEILKGKNYRILNEGDEIDLRGARIRAITTPGHSEGEISFYEINDEAFACADTVGFLYFRQRKAMIPAPFYNFRTCLESIEKIRKLKPKMLLTGHNGAITGDGIEEYLDEGKRAIRKWEKAIITELKKPKTIDELNKVLVKKFPEMTLCPNPEQTSMITDAMTRVLESEGKITKETVEGKVFWKGCL